MPPYGTEGLVSFVVYNTCPAGQYYTTAVVGGIRLDPTGLTYTLRLADADCDVFVSAFFHGLAAFEEWPWITDGKTVNLEAWNPVEGDVRGGDPTWMVLDEPSTGDLLLAVYSGNDYLIRNQTVSERLGAIDVGLEGPTCEYPYESYLQHGYDLTVAAEAGMFSLPPQGRLQIPLEGTTLNVATGGVQVTYYTGHVVLDLSYGSQVNLSVWPAPR